MQAKATSGLIANYHANVLKRSSHFNVNGAVKEFEKASQATVTVACRGQELSISKVEGKFMSFLFLVEAMELERLGKFRSGNGLFIFAQRYYGTDWDRLLAEHRSGAKVHEAVAFFASLEGVNDSVTFTISVI